MAGHSILAHSRPDKIGTPRFLPLYIGIFSIDYQQKKSAQIPYPAITELEMLALFKKRLTIIKQLC
jgi:hypothetical protein